MSKPDTLIKTLKNNKVKVKSNDYKMYLRKVKVPQMCPINLVPIPLLLCVLSMSARKPSSVVNFENFYSGSFLDDRKRVNIY